MSLSTSKREGLRERTRCLVLGKCLMPWAWYCEESRSLRWVCSEKKKTGKETKVFLKVWVRTRAIISGLQQMKKFKLESAKPPADPQPIKPKPQSKEDLEREKKRQQLEREMRMLEGKISDKESSIKQSQKLLNVDEFLRKQKEKTREYAMKLNEEYDKQKKEREAKLYKKYRGDTGNDKLTTTSKNEIPLSILSAVEQAKETEGVRKWVLDDHHYKLDDLVLDVAKGELFGDALREEEEKCLKRKEENSWKRFKEISSNSAEVKYLPVVVEQGQLQPSDDGQLLMSALTIMPKEQSQYLYEQRKGVDREDYFLLRFFPGGERRSVLTDERIEAREYAHKSVNIGSRHRDGVTFWSSLLQKGYRKLYCKQVVPNNLKEVAQVVYGLDPEIVPLGNLVTISENLAKILGALLESHPKSCIGFLNDRSESPDRIFPLLGVEFPIDRKKKKKSVVQQQVKQQIHYHISNPYPGVLKSDFVNKFTLTQLFQRFNRMIFLRQYPEKWREVRIFIEFLSNGPISFTNTEWIKNNQYSFTLSRASEVRLALRRRWGACLEVGEKEEEKMIFGFVLFRSPDGQTEISSMKLQNLISKCKSNDENGCCLNKLLEKGTYILVPFSHYISQQYMQAFNLDILLEREDVLAINKAKIYQYFYENRPANDAKVIQKLQSRIKYEKPKTEKFNPPRLIAKTTNKPLTQKALESLGLTLPTQTKLSDFFIPGKLRSFLLRGQVKEQRRQKKEKKSEQVQQQQRYQRQQSLKILLGYDALDEQTNHGQMMAIVNETSDEIDLANYNLGEEGLMAILQSLMAMPRLTRINLSANGLNDSCITYLCYYLQKGNRSELRELDLSSNAIGKTGAKALKGLKTIFPKLSILGPTL